MIDVLIGLQLRVAISGSPSFIVVTSVACSQGTKEHNMRLLVRTNGAGSSHLWSLQPCWRGHEILCRDSNKMQHLLRVFSSSTFSLSATKACRRPRFRSSHILREEWLCPRMKNRSGIVFVGIQLWCRSVAWMKV